MRRVLVGLVLVIFVGVVGCHRHSFVVGSGGNLNVAPKYSHWHAHWLFGLIGEETVEAKSVCPSGNATVKDQMSFLNGLVALFIGIVYSPTEVEIFCDDSGRSAKLMLSPEQMQKLAFENLPYIPVGAWSTPTGHRDDIIDIVHAGLVLFWGVKRKT